MICHDPTSPPAGGSAFSEKQWTVDEIAQMDEETGAAEAEEAGLAADSSEAAETAGEPSAAETARPASPQRRFVSGRYRGSGRPFELELRVDVDGTRPTLRVSGDFYRRSGATTSYSSSFIVNSPTVRATSARVRIKGAAQFSYSYPNPFPVVEVTIPRVGPHAQPAAATVAFYDTAGKRGASYACDFVSPFFRTVQFEQDVVKGTQPFGSYDTGQLPSGGGARTLSIVSAYAEAGVEVQVSGVSNVLDPGGAGRDRKWSNAELHASMVRQFSLWRDSPQWKVWLLVATDHERGDLRGIMFDQAGKQRQGCAVFYDLIAGDEAEAQRAALRTYVHELGHCFNLLHSWQKTLAVPPQPNRLDALSWMNYVQNYPGGAAAYWAAFPFQFDDPELVHLRHAFRDNVIMGGANFGAGAADFDAEAFFEPLEDNSGLRLELRAHKNFVQSEPVVVELKLSATDLRGRRVHTRLHPDFGFVQLAVQMPNGQTIPYQPLVEQCTETDTVVLDEDNPSIYASAYVGYGRKGFYFDQSGIYNLRAIYHALDGSQVVSNVLTLRVRSPLDRDEDEIADLYSGHDQGTLFHLLGSDSEQLASGNKAFENVLDKHGKHPLAVYAQLVRGINAGRNFKTVTEEKNLDERPPQNAEAEAALRSVVDTSKKGEGVDNITLNMAMRRLARAQEGRGDERGASRTLEDLVSHFRDRLKLRPHIVRQIEARTNDLRTEVLKDGGPQPAARAARKAPAKKAAAKRRKK